MKLSEKALSQLEQFLTTFEEEIGFRPSAIELKDYFKNETFVDELNGLEKMSSSDGEVHWVVGDIKHNDLKIHTVVFYHPDELEEEEELKTCEQCKEEYEYTEDIEEKLCQTCFEEGLARADEEKRYLHNEYRNSVL